MVGRMRRRKNDDEKEEEVDNVIHFNYYNNKTIH